MPATIDSAVFVTVSEDYTNRNQSWEYAAIYRNHSGQYRVHVRANAYEDQSHATVSVWGRDGWTFYTSLPTEEWYADAPSYARRELTLDQRSHFESIRNALLHTLALGQWGYDGIEVR